MPKRFSELQQPEVEPPVVLRKAHAATNAVRIPPDRPIGAMAPSEILALQRHVGNAAVTSLLKAAGAGASAPRQKVQRLSVKASDLGSAMGESTTGRFGVGKSTYATISKGLADYEKEKSSSKPGAEAKLVQLLGRIDRLCDEWLNSHRGDLSPQDADRRAVLVRLAAELPVERLGLSKKQSERVYLDSFSPDAPNRFQAAT